jgi:hypothetical protein
MPPLRAAPNHPTMRAGPRGGPLPRGGQDEGTTGMILRSWLFLENTVARRSRGRVIHQQVIKESSGSSTYWSITAATTVDDLAPRELVGEERFDGDFVGGAQPRRRRAAAPRRRVGERRGPGKARCRAPRRSAQGPGAVKNQSVPNCARNARAVPSSTQWADACRGARVARAPNRRRTRPWSARSTGVHDDVHAVDLDAEERRRLEHFETLVHQCRRIDRDLGPIDHVGWRKASSLVARPFSCSSSNRETVRPTR